MKSLLISSCLLLLLTSACAFVPHHSAGKSSSRFPLFSTATKPLPEGLIKTVSKEGTGKALKRGDIATVKYSCSVVDSPAPFCRSSEQKVVVGDANMIQGWEQAIQTMAVGERAVVRITNPTFAYGAQGIPEVNVGPNAEIKVDMEILDAVAPSTMDFDELAFSDRSASSIQQAYQERLEEKAANMVEPKQGLEGIIEKIKGFYFFGLFEGETGQQAPWILRPSITFPIAFVIVGAAFYVLFVAGGIQERGAQVQDELDEFILTNLVTNVQHVLPSGVDAIDISTFM